MNYSKTSRGFDLVTHPAYPPNGTEPRIVQASSMVGNYDDAIDRPGTSALWISEQHHLNREEVAQLVRHLQTWLETGSLKST